MSPNTAMVDVASPKTDVVAVREHIQNHFSEKEKDSLTRVVSLLCDEEQTISEHAEEIQEMEEHLPHNFVPIDEIPNSENNDLVSNLTVISEEVSHLREHPKGEQVMEWLDFASQYFYGNEIPDEEMEEFQNQIIENDDELTVMIPL